jgi:hypothetical protein
VILVTKQLIHVSWVQVGLKTGNQTLGPGFSPVQKRPPRLPNDPRFMAHGPFADVTQKRIGHHIRDVSADVTVTDNVTADAATPVGEVDFKKRFWGTLDWFQKS